jgi:hypothetical protein
MGETERERREREALEIYAKQLTDMIAASGRQVFKVNGPQSLPVKSRFGKYSTHGFVGDEQLVPMSAYVGKRRSIIYVFKTAFPLAEIAFVEVPSEKAGEALVGFKGWLESRMEMSDDEAMRNAKEERERAEREDRERTAREIANNPIFGSW